MRTIKIIVSCGSGVATSMHVAVKLRKYLQDLEVKTVVDSCNINELPDRSHGYDIIVSTAQVPYDLGKSVINGVPLLTGIGEKETVEQIIKQVKEITS